MSAKFPRGGAGPFSARSLIGGIEYFCCRRSLSFSISLSARLKRKEKSPTFFFLICCWHGLWVHNSDQGGIETFRFRHSILFSIALTSRLKQKRSATKMRKFAANLAVFRSRIFSANATVFGCSKFAANMTFLEGGGGGGGGAAANFLVICALTCRILVIFCSKCEILHRMQSVNNTSSNACG